MNAIRLRNVDGSEGRWFSNCFWRLAKMETDYGDIGWIPGPEDPGNFWNRKTVSGLESLSVDGVMVVRRKCTDEFLVGNDMCLVGKAPISQFCKAMMFTPNAYVKSSRQLLRMVDTALLLAEGLVFNEIAPTEVI